MDVNRWVVEILADDDITNRENDLRDLCDILGLAPITRYRWLTDEILFQHHATLREICKALVVIKDKS